MKTFKEVYRDSGLGKWFHNQSAGGKPGWDRYDSSGKKAGKCGDAKDGEPYAACLSRQKAQKLGKKGVASFVRRKRKAQSAAGKGDKGDGGKGAKPINVKTGVTDKDPKKRGIQEMKTFRDLKVELQEKNVPTNPSLWSSVLSQARSKFDVYPSAYANAWASKQYKKKGGGWKKKTNEDIECPCEDCVCDPCDCGQVDEKWIKRSIHSKMGQKHRQSQQQKRASTLKKDPYDIASEEVEQVDEAVNLSSLLRSKEGYYKLSIKSPKKKVSIFVDHEAPDRDSDTLVYIEVNGKEKLGKDVSSSELKKILKTYLDDAKREGARVSVGERGHPDDPFNEEVEQVDEISRKTAVSALAKAMTQRTLDDWSSSQYHTGPVHGRLEKRRAGKLRNRVRSRFGDKVAKDAEKRAKLLTTKHHYGTPELKNRERRAKERDELKKSDRTKMDTRLVKDPLKARKSGTKINKSGKVNKKDTEWLKDRIRRNVDDMRHYRGMRTWKNKHDGKPKNYKSQYEEVEQVDEKSAAWQRKEGKNREGGLNAAGRRSYERENPGSDLKAPVSAAQAKKSKGGKAAKRRKSFCARMGGMPGPMKDEKGRPTRKALALRKWDC